MACWGLDTFRIGGRGTTAASLSPRDDSLVGINYWERLSHLRVYSQEKRQGGTKSAFFGN